MLEIHSLASDAKDYFMYQRCWNTGTLFSFFLSSFFFFFFLLFTKYQLQTKHIQVCCLNHTLKRFNKTINKALIGTDTIC